ncbi:Hypothetical protein ETEE_0713 [Edwardsiella anguillarum ET080813]|uniref:Uncharacterized protein n=1 Tax=Edwardsiella anguillarum ET080813 TaxID=667120 RepID=A0A076LNA4_9GAMM|nr:Hypothetical protein ETEE_0713 [Edwardsiella anguillarum ET080813]
MSALAGCFPGRRALFRGGVCPLWRGVGQEIGDDDFALQINKVL